MYYFLIHCSILHHQYQRAIIKLRINISIHDYSPFLNSCKCIKFLTYSFQHVAHMTFECKLIVNNNTQKFLLQTAFNFSTIDFNFKVIRGYSCRRLEDLFLLTRRLHFSGLAFTSLFWNHVNISPHNSSNRSITLHVAISEA